MTADLIARLRAGTVTPADLDAAADALEKCKRRMRSANRLAVALMNCGAYLRGTNPNHISGDVRNEDQRAENASALASWEALK